MASNDTTRVVTRTEADAVIEQVRRQQPVTTNSVTLPLNGRSEPFVAVPQADGSVELVWVRDVCTPIVAPLAHVGTTVLHDEASFTVHVQRFKRTDSVIYLERAATTKESIEVQCVYDHDAPDAPRFEEFRASFTPRWSPEVRAWEGAAGQWMDQATFAAFVEEHALELANGEGHANLRELAETLVTTIGTPRQVLSLARTLSVKVSATVHEDVRTATGEGAITFVESHEAREGSTAVQVPALFAIAVPVLDGGPSFVIPARLQYRVQEKRVRWRFTLYRFDTVLRYVQDDLIARLAERTGLPVLAGVPKDD